MDWITELDTVAISLLCMHIILDAFQISFVCLHET